MKIGEEVTTGSGLKYVVTVAGKGTKPTAGQTIKAHYTGQWHCGYVVCPRGTVRLPARGARPCGHPRGASGGPPEGSRRAAGGQNVDLVCVNSVHIFKMCVLHAPLPSRSTSRRASGVLLAYRNTCCCSHINSHNQVRGHRTGSSHSGAEEYPREKHKQSKVVHAYITADAIHASTRNI